MGKGSQQVPTDTTTRTTSLPEYADPYFRRVLQGAEDALLPFRDDYSRPIYNNEGEITGFGQTSNYLPYPGERLTSSNMVLATQIRQWAGSEARGNTTLQLSQVVQYSSTCLRICRTLWMFKSVKQEPTLIDLKQEEMQTL